MLWILNLLVDFKWLIYFQMLSYLVTVVLDFNIEQLKSVDFNNE